MFKGKKRVYILNTIVVLLIIMASFVLTGMWPFGDNSIAAIDLSGQYLGFYDYIAGVFKGDEGLFYSFNKGAGGGMFALWTYYLMSPFNIVYAFFNGETVLQGVQIVYLLKMVALALTATHYFKRKGLEDIYNTMFTVGWVFSGYITMFRIHLMWLDALIYLPLLILALEEGLNSNKYGKYVLFLTLTIYSSYYIGYMVGLFTIIYALYSYYTRDEGQPFYLVGYIKGCILSGILSLWVLIPTAYSMIGGLKTFKIDDLFFNYRAANLLSVLRFIDTSNVGYSDGAPLLMFGTALVIYLVIVLINTTKKQRVAYGLVALIYLLTFTIRPLGRIWTIGQDETWYLHRSAFTFVWFNIVFLVNNKQYLKHELNRVIGVMMSLTWLGTSTFLFMQDEAVYTIIGFITFIFGILYGVVILIRFSGKELVLLGLLGIEVIAMLTYQGLFIDTKFMNDVRGNKELLDATMEIVEQNRDPMSRVYFGNNAGYYNNGFTLGEPTITHTSSTIGKGERHLYKQVGMVESYSIVGTAGMNGFSATLLNVEYIDTQFSKYFMDGVKNNPQFELISDNLYYNTARLGLGYTVSDLIESPGREFNMDGITQVLTGETYTQEMDLEILDMQNVTIGNGHYTVQEQDKEAYIDYVLTEGVNYVLKHKETVSVEVKNKDTNDGVETDDMVEEERVQDLAKNFLNYVEGDAGDIYRFQIKFDEFVVNKTMTLPKFYNIDMGAFTEDIQGYFDTYSSFTLTEQGRGTLTGTVNNEHNDPYLQISIPYEEGWEAYINGVEQDVLNSMDYLAISIPEGESEVEFVYHTPLLRESVVVSLALAIVFVGGDALYVQRKRKKQEDTSHKLDDGNQTM